MSFLPNGDTYILSLIDSAVDFNKLIIEDSTTPVVLLHYLVIIY